MTSPGAFMVCLTAVTLAALVFHQLLRHRLYVGYAVAWLLVMAGVVCLTVIPPLNRLTCRVAESLFPSFSLTIISLGFVTLVLIYFSVQLSMLSERVTRIAQSLAISNLEHEMASKGGMQNQ